ncbi:MAG: glycoside hydrolase family 127 protein [Actinobacteria bacterium]|nr:glycoside hydrolase family 127 protein [Actinomycetota bacterium]
MPHRIFLTIFLTAILLIIGCKNKKQQAVYQSARPVHEMGIISTSSSPNAKLHDVPISAVTLGDGFWQPRLQANKDRSIPELLRLLEEHGVVDNFRRLSGRRNVERRGYLFTDSDLFKWMEAAALVLQSGDDPQLKAKLDSVIDDVLAAQGKDGYLNTYHQGERANERFTKFKSNHELYCLGHLIQAGIAYYCGSGERRLLDGAIKYADYVISLFGPDKRQCFPGHPEIEMALVELYRTTGDRKYLDFADYLLNHVQLDKIEEKMTASDFQYLFSGLPFTSRKELKSHAVRAMYACCGATDLYMETGNPAVWETLQTLWKDMSQYKIYVTGGVGSRYQGEAFGNKYELPNERAYTETCAAIGNIMWNWRLLNVTGDERYTEIMERALYNGFLSGVSLTGDRYFYRNPLTSFGDNERQPWYNCTCCPPNVERTLAKIPGYIYSTSPEGLWVHLYHSNELNWHLDDGQKIRVKQVTKYPWENKVEITLNPKTKKEFSLFLRIPEWTPGASVSLNGEELKDKPVNPGSYFEIRRKWKRKDVVVVEFEMPVRAVFSNPRLGEDLGSVALQRGPVVYCLESPDFPNTSVFDVALPLDPENPQKGFTTQFQPDLLGGIVVLRKNALAYEIPMTDQPLYRYAPFKRPTRSVELKAIPYYAWANRGVSKMEVWVPWVKE